jgi:tetratricopeptide (TPR) repeat protein
MHAISVRRTLASFATALLALSLSFSAMSADDPRERAAMLAATAEKILNTWVGEPEVVAHAEKLIEEALALDPDSGHAMVEKGRAILMSNGFTRYGPLQVRDAGALFTRASQLKPPYGRGFVLLGHLYTVTGKPQEAFAALTQAEALVPQDPWLKLNWGALYAAQGKYDMQAWYAEQALATGTTNIKAIRAANEVLLASALRKGDREKSDAIYAKALESQGTDAWLRGNYAQSVILYFADFEVGEKLAREALGMMDYGHARSTLSLALYGRWAQAEKDGKSLAEQERLFDAANRNDPGGRRLPECAMSSRKVMFVFEAVFRKGVERHSLQRC